MKKLLLIALLIVGCEDNSLNDTSKNTYYDDIADICIDNYYPDTTLYEGNTINDTIIGITNTLLIGNWELINVFGYNNYCCADEPDTTLDLPTNLPSYIINADGIQYNADSSISNYIWNVPNTSNLCFYYTNGLSNNDLNCSVFYEVTDNNLTISDPTPNSESCLQLNFIPYP